MNSDVVFWQWLAFGKNTVYGIPGSGNWTGGTCGAAKTGNLDHSNGWQPVIYMDEMGTAMRG